MKKSKNIFNSKWKNLKDRGNGITLIALVITIIVLLILAGVTIVSLTGDNGLLQKATTAKQKNEEGTAKEKVQLAWTSAYAEYLEERSKNADTNKEKYINAENLTKYLDGTKEQITNVTKENDSFIVDYVNQDKSSFSFLIDSDGKIGSIGNGNASEIASDKNNIGKIVNYGVSINDSTPEWKILYADDTNVYIILSENIIKDNMYSAANESSGYNGTSDFEILDTTKYPAIADGWLYKIYDNGNILFQSDKPNMKRTEYLLDSTNPKWKELKSDNAKWIIGSPSLELLVASYNMAKSTNITIENLNNIGYPNTITSGLSSGTVWNTDERYYLACPSNLYQQSMKWIHPTNRCVDENGYTDWYYIRPVVCLKSNVTLKWNETTNKYDLETSIKY